MVAERGTDVHADVHVEARGYRPQTLRGVELAMPEVNLPALVLEPL